MTAQTKEQRMWAEAEKDFAPDERIQVHSYVKEIYLHAIARTDHLIFQLSPDEARTLAKALSDAADRIDGGS